MALNHHTLHRCALLTQDFRVVITKGQGLALNAIGRQESLDSLVCLAQRGDSHMLVSAPPYTFWYDGEHGIMNRPLPTGLIEPKAHGSSDLVRLRCGNVWLGVDEDGHVAPLVQEEAQAALFRLVPWDEMVALWHVCRQNWVLGPDATLARVNEANSTFHDIRFGSLCVPYEDFIQAICHRPAEREFFLLSEANLYRAVLFRPALLYVVFGSRVLQEFSAALEGVEDPGGWTYEIFVATDAPDDLIYLSVPEALRGQIRTVPMRGFDQTDYVSARQTMLSSGILDGYGPVVYMDGDVAVNVPLEPLMLRAALERKVSAQLEYFHADFRYSDSSGAVLFRQDPYPVGMVEPGFNSGVMLVPDVSGHRRYLDPAFHTNMTYTGMKGRKSIPFYEQSVMNYALRKMDDFDARFISTITEVGGNPRSPIVQHYGCNNPANARGFVHFWCTHTGVSRSDIVRGYLHQLRAYRRENGLDTPKTIQENKKPSS